MRKALWIVTLLCLQSGVTEAANWRAEAVQIILKYGREYAKDIGFHASSTIIFELLKDYVWASKENVPKADGNKQGPITPEDARKLRQLLDRMLSDRNYLDNLNPDLVRYAQSWQRCTQAIDADLMIGSCTAVIKAASDTNDNLAIAFNNRGFSYQRKGDYDRAIKDYNQAIQLNSQLKQLYMNRGVALAETKQYDRDGKDFDDAIRLAPYDPIAVYNRGHVYDDLRQYDSAIKYYDRAVQLNPHYADAIVNRGMVYYDTGRYDAAIEDFNRVIQINPRYTAAYVNRGMAYNQKKDFNRAFRDWDAAFSLDPKFACSELLGSRLPLSVYLQSRGCSAR